MSQVMTFPVIVKIPVEISIQTQTPRVFALDGNEIVLHPKVIEWMQAQRRYVEVFNNKHSEPEAPADCDSLVPVEMFNDKHEPVEKPKRKKSKQ